MKSIITAAVLLATTSLPLQALESEDAFNAMYKAKYDQLMAMPYIEKVAECLGGWVIVSSDSDNILFKYSAWHSEKLTNMIINDKSISSVEAAHRMRAMQDFSRYFPEGIYDSEIARIIQKSEFSTLMISQCMIYTDTGKLGIKPHK